MRQWARARVVAAVSISLGIITGCGGDSDGADGPARVASEKEVEAFDPALAKNLPPGITPEAAQEGREQFVVCATCHGLDARGTQLGPALRDQEWIHIDGSFEQIQQVIRTGIPEPKEFPVPMPAGGGGAFTDAQLREVAAYVYALSRTP